MLSAQMRSERSFQRYAVLTCPFQHRVGFDPFLDYRVTQIKPLTAEAEFRQCFWMKCGSSIGIEKRRMLLLEYGNIVHWKKFINHMRTVFFRFSSEDPSIAVGSLPDAPASKRFGIRWTTLSSNVLIDSQWRFQAPQAYHSQCECVSGVMQWVANLANEEAAQLKSASRAAFGWASCKEKWI